LELQAQHIRDIDHTYSSAVMLLSITKAFFIFVLNKAFSIVFQSY